MNHESEGKDRYHDCHYRKCHEVAACLEESVCRTVFSCERVNHGKEVDCHVKKKEDDEEQAAYAHDKLLAD